MAAKYSNDILQIVGPVLVTLLISLISLTSYFGARVIRNRKGRKLGLEEWGSNRYGDKDMEYVAFEIRSSLYL